MSERTYSSREVCAATGVSYRQLDYWIRKGLIEATGGRGSGTQRRFTEAQLARVIEVVRTLRQAKRLLDEHGLGSFLESSVPTNVPRSVA